MFTVFKNLIHFLCLHWFTVCIWVLFFIEKFEIKNNPRILIVPKLSQEKWAQSAKKLSCHDTINYLLVYIYIYNIYIHKLFPQMDERKRLVSCSVYVIFDTFIRHAGYIMYKVLYDNVFNSCLTLYVT